MTPPSGDGDSQRDDACSDAEPWCDGHEDDWKELKVSKAEANDETVPNIR